MKNKLIVFTTLSFLSLGLVAMSVQSCSKDSNSPWDGFDFMEMYKNNIDGYYNNSIGENAKVKSGKQKVYIDFSDGMIQAYSTNTNKKVIDYISQKLVGSNVDWYGLGKKHNGIGKLEYTNDRDIYNKVVTPSNYQDIYAPIEDALKKITSGKNDALLITDFEEYTPDGKEQMFSYPKKYFIDWVKAGNTITFYYSRYTETNPKSRLTDLKNIYYVIFSYGQPSESSLLTKFNLAITNQGLSDLNKFEINPNSYTISNNYGGKDLSGLTPDEPTPDLKLDDKAGVLMSNYNAPSMKYESLEFGLNLNDLHKFYFQEKGRFTKNLFLDGSKSPSYDLKSIKVEVSDVTKDYLHFLKCAEASKNKPKFTKDEGNNKVWDESTKNNSIIVECYDKNTGDLKKEYVYSYKRGENIQEIFDFDNKVFQDHLKNSPNKIELITSFHKNYKAGKITSNEPVILRLDYTVNEVNPNYSNQLEDFKWNSIINKSNGVNESLYQAVRNTIQEVKPTGILYSYYLKLEPNIK